MRVVLVLAMCLSATYCLAQSSHAYKSVHADGTVSYSDTRPGAAESVTEVDLYRDSATEQQGKQRMEELAAASSELEEQRAEKAEARREYESRVAGARQEVTGAQRGLVMAQQSKKNATPERIALAEQRVRLAKQRLREVQSAGP
jgi:hypothetical protein